MKFPMQFLFCFNSFSSSLIETLIIILSSIGLVISLIGAFIIPWGYTSRVMEAFYIICLIFFFYSLVISASSLYIRKNRKGNFLSRACIISSLFNIITCILSIIIYIVIFIVLIPDLKSKSQIKNVLVLDPETGEYNTQASTEQSLVSDGEMIFSIITVALNLILWLILLFLWISEHFRQSYNICGSYNEYLEEQKNKSIDNSKNNEYNIVGHDKYGLPIYNIKNGGNIGSARPRSESIFKSSEKTFSKYDVENNNILKYSYKEKLAENLRRPSYKSLDIIHKRKKEKEKHFEKYLEKYLENGEVTKDLNQYYFNFSNKTALNLTDANNSINPGN
jgi:hypothetical protein